MPTSQQRQHLIHHLIRLKGIIPLGRRALLHHERQDVSPDTPQRRRLKHLPAPLTLAVLLQPLVDDEPHHLAQVLGGAHVARVGLEGDPAADGNGRVDEADEGREGRRLQRALVAGAEVEVGARVDEAVELDAHERLAGDVEGDFGEGVDAWGG